MRDKWKVETSSGGKSQGSNTDKRIIISTEVQYVTVPELLENHSQIIIERLGKYSIDIGCPFLGW